MPDENPDQTSSRKHPGVLSVIASTLAAAVGIQSSRNRERDFKQGNIWVFAISGLIFTVLFILTLVGIVRLVT